MTIASTIQEAQRQVRVASAELDAAVNDMIEALLPRLRQGRVYTSNLVALKRALRGFDAHRKYWRT